MSSTRRFRNNFTIKSVLHVFNNYFHSISGLLQYGVFISQGIHIFLYPFFFAVIKTQVCVKYYVYEFFFSITIFFLF